MFCSRIIFKCLGDSLYFVYEVASRNLRDHLCVFLNWFVRISEMLLSSF